MNGGILNVNGTLAVAGGTAMLAGGSSVSSLNVSGGSVSLSGSMPVTVQSLSLSGGSINGSAPLALAGSAVLSGGTLAPAGGVMIPSGASVTIAGPVLSTAPLSNAGTVMVASGTLELDGGGTQTGTFMLAMGSTLAFGGSAGQMLSAGSMLSGAGAVQFAGMVQATIGGTYSVGATAVAGQAQVSFVAPASTGTLTVSGGTLTIGTSGNQPMAAPMLRPLAGVMDVLDVLSQCTFSGGQTSVLPGWTLDSSAGLLFTGGSPVIDLMASNTAPGTLLLGGDVGFTATSGDASVLSVGAGTNPGTFDLGGKGRTFSVNHADNPDDLTIGADVTDGSISKNGAGLLRLTSPDTYAGGTTDAMGTIEVDDVNALGTGPLTIAGGMLALRTPGGQPLPNAIQVNATDTLSLDVGAGAVTLATPQLGSTLMVTGSPGGSLTLVGSLTLRHDLDVNTTVPVTISGAIGDGGGGYALTKTGTGTLMLAGTSADSWSGMTEVDEGTLMLDDSGGPALPGDVRIDGPSSLRLMLSNQLPATASITFDDTLGVATLDLNGHSQSLAALHSFQSGAGLVLLGGGTLNVADESGFSGAVLASGSAADVSGAGVSDGSAAEAQSQRSEVRQVVLSLDRTLALPASDFSLAMLNTGGSGRNDGSPPTSIPLASVMASLASPDGGMTWAMTFKPNTAWTDATGSLLDGIFTLAVNSPAIATGGYTITFHRLYGDLNGDGQVNNADYFQFRKAFNTSTGQSGFNADLDFNNDGQIGNADYFQFRKRFLKQFTY